MLLLIELLQQLMANRHLELSLSSWLKMTRLWYALSICTVLSTLSQQFVLLIDIGKLAAQALHALQQPV
jgi:hypothetical protein